MIRRPEMEGYRQFGVVGAPTVGIAEHGWAMPVSALARCLSPAPARSSPRAPRGPGVTARCPSIQMEVVSTRKVSSSSLKAPSSARVARISTHDGLPPKRPWGRLHSRGAELQRQRRALKSRSAASNPLFTLLHSSSALLHKRCSDLQRQCAVLCA